MPQFFFLEKAITDIYNFGGQGGDAELNYVSRRKHYSYTCLHATLLNELVV